jgi:hypothetical protein
VRPRRAVFCRPRSERTQKNPLKEAFHVQVGSAALEAKVLSLSCSKAPPRAATEKGPAGLKKIEITAQDKGDLIMIGIGLLAPGRHS